MSSRVRFVVLACVLAIAGTSCGGSGSGGGSTDGVKVTLKEFSLAATPATFSAGDVEFAIQNEGSIAHEFVIIRTDLAPDALPVENGLIPEDKVDLVDEAEDIAPSTSTSLSANLDAGSYVLVCNLPTHYGLGMYAAFTVA